MYVPTPLDTSGVVLPPDILELTELIAENIHDVWAAGRIADGWTYGPVKDSTARTTPDLVPYSDLPDSEKAYDRNTALETLKLIVKLGYRIGKVYPEYRELIRRLDEIHGRMFDEMGLYEVSDPRLPLVYDLADIMTPLRNFVPGETASPSSSKEEP